MSWMWLLPAAAQELTLTYEDALRLALERNVALLQADADLMRAEGALLAARATFGPTLSMDGGWRTSLTERLNQDLNLAIQNDAFQPEFNATLAATAVTGTQVSLTYAGSRQEFQTRYLDLRSNAFVSNPFDPNAGDEPEVEITYPTTLTAQVTQPLFEGHSLAFNLQGVRQAVAGRDTGEATQRVTQQQTLASVATAYWNLSTQEELVAIAEQAVDVAEEERRIVLARVAAGDLAPVETSRVEAALAQAQSNLIDARNTAAAAADELLLAIGEAPGRAVRAVTEPAAIPPLDLESDALVAHALRDNPQVQAARLTEELEETDLRATRHARLPQINAVGRYTAIGLEPTLGNSLKELRTGRLYDVYVGGTASIPLLDRADRGAYLQAQADYTRAKLEREQLERTVTQQVLAQIRVLESARTKVDLAEANLVFAEQTLTAERALQEAGRAIQKDVLDAIRAADDARVQLERAKADFQVALIELERLKGTL